MSTNSYHLFGGELSDRVDPNGDIENLLRNEVAVHGATFHPSQLDEHAEVPLEVDDVLVVVLRANVHQLQDELVAKLVANLAFGDILHQALHDLHQILLRHHAVEQVERSAREDYH